MEHLALTLAITGAAILVLPLLRPKDDRARATLFGICILLSWRYLWWRFDATLPPFQWRFESLFAWAFSIVEAIAILGWTISFVTLSRSKDRSAEVIERSDRLNRMERLPRVDVLITTYNEEEPILTRTIVGALGIDFPGVRVWVLDDGNRPWVETLCRSKGAYYLDRSDNAHAKAGNINHALEFISAQPNRPEFVAVFDADFVPQRAFLWRTVPLFQNPQIGLVQTPQHFFNKDPIQSNLLIGDVWPDEQRFFFDHVMPSKDAWGAAFCCGTSSVIRVRALQEVGGFPTESVTEDFLLSLQLDRFGWRTIYLNEPLSAELAPEGMAEYLTQRGRWCLGLMQIIRSALGPFSFSSLSLRYRIGLIDAFLYWSGGFLFKLFCLVTPIVYWFTGVTVGKASPGDVVEYFVPYYAAGMIALYWATGGLIQPLLTDVSHVLTMPAALKGTFIGLLKPRGHRFKVTDKGGRRDRLRVHWGLIGRFGLLATLTVVGMLYASLADFTPERQSAGSAGIMLFWSAYNILVLLLAITACIELPRYRIEERLATSEPVRCWTSAGAFTASLSDISVTGASILAHPPGALGETAMLRINEIGDIAGRIVRISEKAFAVEFIEADKSRDALIRKLYSGRYFDNRGQVKAHRLFQAVVARALR
jgi:cellulose synthase/poly-beta-1,6-N-acetylglucosamine synthase-like glycosyltransferase